METRKRLRVGLLIDSFHVPAWTYRMLERIQHSNYAEIVLIVLNETARVERNPFAKIKDNRHSLLYILYQRLEDRLFKPVPNALETKDVKPLLDNIRVVKVKPEQKQFSDWIADHDLEEIHKSRIDVFVRLGFRILRGGILQAARYGVWSYHHGDTQVYRGGPPGFWEVMEGHPVTGSTLQILTEDLDNGRVLFRSFSATDYLSVNRNRNNYYWKTLAFLPRKLQQLHRAGEESFFCNLERENGCVNFYSSRLYRTPTNGKFFGAVTRHLLRYAKFKLNDLLYDHQWILMFDLRDGISGSPWRFKQIRPSNDRFWADPHVIYKDDRYYVFFEELIYKKQKGHISVLVIDEKGHYTAPFKILERPYHLSYPFVFCLEGEYYMIPDTEENRTIEIYKCVEFPNQWDHHKTIMRDVRAVDSTVFFHQNKWWLFTNIREYDGASSWDELFLFYADNPLSDHWNSHPANPIVSDVRKSRPGGRIFELNGQIFRPSQDCSKGYGYGIRLNRITAISETEYREEEVGSILPGWERNITGTHTFNHTHRLTIIDAKLRRPRFLRRNSAVESVPHADPLPAQLGAGTTRCVGDRFSPVAR